MNTLVRLIRWHNRWFPWNQHKHSLARLADRWIDPPPEPAVYDGMIGGLKMSLDLRRQFERWIYMNVYEPVTLQILRRVLSPGDTFVDAGANIGLFTLYAAGLVGPTGQVIAFEPHPDTAGRLRLNRQLNGLDQIRVIQQGCWSRQGHAVIHDFSNDNSLLSSMRERTGEQLAHTHEIQTTAIDQQTSAPVRLLKMDVEGAEFEALRGAERALFGGEQAAHLIIELNRQTAAMFGYQPMDIVRWLLERQPDYRLRLIQSRRWQGVGVAELERAMTTEPDKLRNVWFEPPETRSHPPMDHATHRRAKPPLIEPGLSDRR